MRVKIKIPGLCLAIFFSVIIAQQPDGRYESNMLASFLGKDAISADMKDLKAYYNFEMVNEAHYLSRGGIELLLQKGVLSEIHLYKSSAVYGSFKNKLPNNLRFGMSSGEVRRLLGKPLVSYNSGYCEFELAWYIISCWFDNGALSQVGLVLKPAF